MEIYQANLFGNALLHSLSTIQTAKTRFRSLTASCPTPTALVLQIRLCDVLLGEIRAISCNLERRLESRRIRRRPSVARRRRRSEKEPARSRLG